jgi:Tfp pilus assembly protein PilF
MATLVICSLAGMFSTGSQAGAIHPQTDDEIIEVLPAVSGDRAELRALRATLAGNPTDVESALRLSSAYMEQARRDGDARLAGRALAVLKPWPDARRAPDAILLKLAGVQQYLHDFDAALNSLRILVTRVPDNAQAWLTIATILRVQGKYIASDEACESLAGAGVRLYHEACVAENASLRGEFRQARASLSALLNAPLPPETRNWLLTTLAENEVRAGQAASAERAYRAALDQQRDSYTIMSFSDFLLDQHRPAEALKLLEPEPRSDAVLLRIAMAGKQLHSSSADADIRELHDRMELAALRPEARVAHAREEAMFVQSLGEGACAALDLARVNVGHQREPLDLLLFARVAKSCGDEAAERQAAAVVAEVGLRDARIDALR